MLEYDKIGISEWIGINKTNTSKEFGIGHYWYFKDIGFKYEPFICNGCHDLRQKYINFNNFAIVCVKGRDYRIHFWYMGKDDATNVMKNSNLNAKSGLLSPTHSLTDSLVGSLRKMSVDEWFPLFYAGQQGFKFFYL